MMPDLLQTTLSLALVLGALGAAAWALARWYKPQAGTRSAIKVHAMTSVGARERVVLLEVGRQWLLVGVAPGQVNTLLTLTESPFAEGKPGPGTRVPTWVETYLNQRNAR